MRLIALSTLGKFWESSSSYADSIEQGMAWYRETLKADWSTPNEVRRVVVWINYTYRVVHIRFVGTHRQYDEIDTQTI